MSLRNRVALAGGLVVLAALALAAAILYPVLDARLSSGHDAALVAATKQAPSLLQVFKEKELVRSQDGPLKPAPPSTAIQIPTEAVEVGGTHLQFLVPPLTQRTGNALTSISSADLQVAEGVRPGYFSNATVGGMRYRVFTAELFDPATGAPMAGGVLVRAAAPDSQVSGTLERMRVALLAIVAGGTLLAAAGARLAAGRVLRPVRRLTETVEHVTATQDLGAVVEAHGRDEIGRLARAFATMMTALDESVNTQRRLVADASHELRTPLTSLTTNLELLEEGNGLADPQAPALVRDARRQSGELTGLVTDLIDLARYGQVQPHTQDTRLDLLAERVVERAAARTDRVVLATELAECLVHVDPDAVERAIGNLVDNAVKWSPDGGRIDVRVESRGTLTVSDEGPGIPQTDLPYVFDRFYRSPAARSRPGSGLGLAIVRQIAETHDGTVTAEPLTRGVRLRLTLPPALS